MRAPVELGLFLSDMTAEKGKLLGNFEVAMSTDTVTVGLHLYNPYAKCNRACSQSKAE